MGFKIFDMRCEAGHTFEAWFSSAEDCDGQMARGLVECPFCGVKRVLRLPTAARISALADPAASESVKRVAADPEMGDLADAAREKIAEIYRRVKAVSERARDVGKNFAGEARAIQRGEKPAEAIRGQCTPEEAKRLLEEGIPVLPIPESTGKTLN